MLRGIGGEVPLDLGLIMKVLIILKIYLSFNLWLLY
ncbi:hypothetical protein KAB03_03607 [Acinetobacter baumannii]|nr:hypothetical protein DU202_03915 [Acinetobacter baumannii DU202]AOX79172.1 hypothetical protein KAB03_03607 [Acinetobacter baumannii]ENU14680.1 hypothetical protein F996_00223 [Acinetobacter baumannii NIPH 24]ENU52720.1 hypothetical protein F982_03477 [Acinetobacter baumannii NIPH 1362]ENW55372.1 hypothetical protein F916_03424 [Acinetobacter baumannii NIPH 528]QCS03787.1 hypothetical protein DMO12_10500 [Acinetobacter baumannii ACICU]